MGSSGDQVSLFHIESCVAGFLRIVEADSPEGFISLFKGVITLFLPRSFPLGKETDRLWVNNSPVPQNLPQLLVDLT